MGPSIDAAFLEDFRHTVDRVADRLLGYSDDEAAERPAPGKWSRKEAWVRLQRYQDRPWVDLVRLWQSYNHHIATIMETAEAGALERPRTRHNLHELAWQPVPASEPATLAYFMRDYVGHLKHHLQQLRIGN